MGNKPKGPSRLAGRFSAESIEKNSLSPVTLVNGPRLDHRPLEMSELPWSFHEVPTEY